MNRTRTAIASLAAMALFAIPVAPAAAGPVDTSTVRATRTTSGSERLCVGVDDPAPVGDSTTWVCSPEARWYGDMIVFLLSLRPA